MATNRISVLIDVTVDRANQALSAFRKSVGEADGAVGKFKAGTASMGASLKANVMPVAAAAGAAVAAFAAKAVSAASDLSESTNAVNVSFGEAAEGVLELGEGAAKSMGLSKSAFNEAAVGFAAFADNIAGPGGDVSAVIGDITTRASDFASVMNLEVTEAANVFRSALSGETEPIKKFGIDMSAAAVEAYALANGLVESKSEMTEAIKVQARYGLLMKRTSKFQGDFANTSDGLANSGRIAAARMEDLQATIGSKLLPVVEDATGLLLGLADAFEAVGDNGVVKFGNQLGLFNNVFGVTRSLWDKGPGSLLKMATGFEEATEATDAMVASTVENRRRTDEYTGAVDDATEATEANSEALEAAARANKRAKESIEARKRALEDAAEAERGAQSASLSYRQQVADTAEAIRIATEQQSDATLTDGERAQAARDAESAVLAQADAAVDFAEEQAAANGQTLSAKDKTAAYIRELWSLVGTLSGPAAAEIQAHIDRLSKIPTSISTSVAVRTSTSTGTNSAPVRRIHSGGVAGGENFTSNEVPAILEADEVVLNREQQASVRDAIGAAGGGGPTIHLTVNALNPQQAGKEIAKSLEAFYRGGGRRV